MRLKASMINAIKFPLNNVLLNESLCFSGVLVGRTVYWVLGRVDFGE